MSVSDPLLDSYNCPAFLRTCNAYREYLVKTEARELKLPLYTMVSLYEENQLRKLLLIVLTELCW